MMRNLMPRSMKPNQPLLRVVLIVALPVLILILAGVMRLTRDDTSPESAVAQPTPTFVPPLRLSAAEIRARPLNALYRIEERAAVAGWSSAMHQQAGYAYLGLDDLAGTIAHWSQAELRDPVFLRQLAETALQAGEFGIAIDTIEKLLELDSENNWANFQLGILLAASDPARAAEHLSEVTDDANFAPEAFDLLAEMTRQADDPRLGMRIGLALLRHERWAAAEQAFRYTASVAYPFPDALAYLGLVREYQGKDGDANLHEALELGPEMPQVHYVLGLIFRHRGELEASRESFALAVALDPTNPAYYAELGQAHRLMYDFDIADYWLRTAVAMSGGEAVFEDLLARFYAEHGAELSDTSLSTMRKAVDVLPTDPDLLAGMGLALHNAGDTPAGVELIDTALALSPGHPLALMNKARIYIDAGAVMDAVELLEQVAATDSPYALDALQELEGLESGETQNP